MQPITISMFPSNANVDVERITNIVNRVYRTSENGLWKKEVVRTSMEEIREFIQHGEIAVAQTRDTIVGCVRIRQVHEETGELGMLAVDETYQGNGIGRALIHFAEKECKKENLQKIQLELLVPEEGAHPAKVALEKWYKRLGYQPVRTEMLETSYPKLAPMLAVPCKFIVFEKELKETQMSY
ncbi:GNAT family N-acetyltransferase [Aliibacillus thermotolerans]|uniref:GNAT family N-acetyltransferase n=1 Tax=Aliibacillus thermotolerans TaxID=1834418 RepID=A0ABW0UA89_9BACI|nr:GNAT family N-acetyltransferase [Aliibacillus thermotolerans]MDA3129623.1 GNAT family N-acetyltransferase [Aliibacillus thermotolerans]